MSRVAETPRKHQTRHQTFPLHIHIATLFLLLVVGISLALTFLSYHRGTRVVEGATDALFERIARETRGEFSRLIDPATSTTALLAQQRAVLGRTLAERLDSLGYYTTALRANPGLVSLYSGYANGDFFLVRRIADAREAASVSAPAGTAFTVQSIERDAARAEFLYFDAALRPLGRTARPDYLGYDPRQRTWYTLAASGDGVLRTDPYVFFTTGRVGLTLTQRSPIASATVGADIELDSLTAALHRQRVTPGSEAVLFDDRQQVIAYLDSSRTVRPASSGNAARLAQVAELGIPVLTSLAAGVGVRTQASAPGRSTDSDGVAWRSAISQLTDAGAQSLHLALAVPEHELLAEVRQTRRQSLLLFGLLLLVSIPLTLYAARLISRPLERLADEAAAVRRFDFSPAADVRSVIREVDDLAFTLDAMRATIRRFLDVSNAIAAEEDFGRLLPHLLDETASAAGADAGVLYLVADNGASLLPAALHQAGKLSALDSASAQALGNAPAVLREVIAAVRSRAIAGCITRTEGAQFGLDVLGLNNADEAPCIAVALCNRKHQLVGAMLLFGSAPADEDKLSFITALSGNAAVSLEAREHINAQKALFEAFIQLLASAIDAKSPYTGGHCARVPELTKMLVRAACDATDGPYRDFQLNEDEWEAVHVAGWLHDCGKITTPEYVVDKATKLETIYDRIHEVRMRFEVLKRDAEITCLQRIAAGEAADTCRAQLAEQWRTLDEEFAFIATCNEGGEFMAPEKIERLQRIATRTWQRTLDDRLGVSRDERKRKDTRPAQPLPATEPLLADRPEHCIPREGADLIPPDNRWGFRVNQPELLYNRGELYNLAISRGTLTEEERYKINHHIIQTIVMLSALPFPKHLQNVPELAGGHHEKMDGGGYPKRLTREQMSPVARMMAIADIFEALTAADRPYKPGKTLSESLKIMAFMRKDQHIDAELFELFLRSGVYRQYAERFMQPAQIDEVNIEAYL